MTLKLVNLIGVFDITIVHDYQAQHCGEVNVLQRKEKRSFAYFSIKAVL